MKPCICCGYTTTVNERGYCRVCLSIGANKINENPNAFGDSKYLIPPLAWCTNRILDAVATRAEAGESEHPNQPATGRTVFLVLSPVADGEGPSEFVEVQDSAGNAIKLHSTKVLGTNFEKIGPFVLPK